MKSPIFIDTSYVLALVNTGDQHHQQARAAASLTPPPFITTEAVLVEIGNALARTRWRSLAVTTLQALRSDANIEIITVGTPLLDQAIRLYESRPDKEWGLTDCISFVVMAERNLTHALTTDHHFQQAGYQTLLAETWADL